MSIQQNFPAISPSLSLNFARSKTLDPRITFTRTSSATRVNETGLVEVVPANSPRFDHSYDPVSGSVRSLGLLVEEQRSNFLLRSQELDNVSWGRINVGIVTNTSATVAPDGTNTAEKLVEDNINSVHYLFAGFTSSANTTYTISFFAKAAERTKIRIAWAGAYYSSGSASMDYDLSLGTANVVGGSQGSSTATIIPYPNGWYRCIATSTVVNATSSQLPQIIMIDNSLNQNYQGDGTSGIYVWGAQLETGSFPTSYIPTTNSTVTRTADNASMVGDNFSSWYNQSEGTFYSQFKGESRAGSTGSVTKIVYSISDGSFNNSHYGITPESNGDMYWYSVSSGVGQGLLGIIPLQPFSSNFVYKSAYAIKTDDRALSINGYIDTDSTATLPVVNRLYIGSSWAGTSIYLGGHISQLTYYPRRLTNAQLINLTK